MSVKDKNFYNDCSKISKQMYLENFSEVVYKKNVEDSINVWFKEKIVK